MKLHIIVRGFDRTGKCCYQLARLTNDHEDPMEFVQKHWTAIKMTNKAVRMTVDIALASGE